ncbi:GPALPP motifs-containing protein 1-like [Portunus trituberculatus]|uniref:GPALPP motifs-containing protein 1-like n=1 Tax=Portunus trituberculatus TaxID=210409 RepID=UPI001E1CD0F5|nr:GPALPP motifs-containing protein 1-like [Portunus trituberculatus]XP_045134512.1 GPALPP motifs-containing protein 1-like [Portunus trituberculatus]XP_045134513.1 GPALPP motifs-containing protein 1-like [Portunus trituberculatus]
MQDPNNSESEEEGGGYGPAPPPHMQQKGSDKSESEDEGEEYCPALPPHMLQRGSKTSPQSPERRSIVGPILPKGFAPPTEEPPVEEDAKESEEEEEETGPVIGPVPPVDKVNPKEYRAWELEERARKMKEKLEGRDVDSNKPLARESWMTELPDDKPNFCGLGPRQFLRKTPTERGDRSCWTDTPGDRARKAKEQEQQRVEESTPEESATKQRDKDLTEKVDEYNKNKRAKPLVELHRKELKRKQSSEGTKERRPFSREEDLNVNKFDDAQRESVLKKARQLNDRFSSGKAKFL